MTTHLIGNNHNHNIKPTVKKPYAHELSEIVK